MAPLPRPRMTEPRMSPFHPMTHESLRAWDEYTSFLARLHESTGIDDALQLATEAIAACGLFHCAVISLHDGQGNLGPIGYHGVPKELIDGARRAPRVSKDVRESILREEFRRGQSYYVPVESGLDLNDIARRIPPQVPLDSTGSWQPGDELFTPLRRPDGDVFGFCSVDNPCDGQRPDQATLDVLEMLVAATSEHIQIIQLQDSLAHEQARFDRLLTLTGDVHYRIDLERRCFTSVSEAIAQMTGADPTEFVDLPFADWLRKFVHPDDRERVCLGPDDAERVHGDDVDWSVTSEYRIVHRDGTIRWVRDSSLAQLDDDGLLIGFDGLLRDITRSHRLTQALADVQRDYHLMVDKTRDLVYMHDDNGRIVYVSPSVEQYLGVTPEDIVGSHFSEWLSDSPMNQIAFDLVETQIHGQQQGEPHILELRARNGRLLTMEFNEALVFDDNGQVVGVQGVGRDVTERERTMAELRDSRKRLDAANTALKSLVAQSRARQERTVDLNRRLEEKNAELESFLHIVAHDLRSPLVSIRGLAGLLRRRYANQLDERGHQITRQLGEEASRLAQLVGDVLTYAVAGAEVAAPHEVDLHVLLQTVWSRLETQGLAHNATLATPSDSIAVRGDPTALERVIENLFVNAITHHSPERESQISVEWNRDDTGVTLQISDNGVGIPPEDRPHVFELFYRGRNADNCGSGLGLAIVKRIIDAHHGTISCSPNHPKGTTFTLRLPHNSPTQSPIE
ncbi:MAG: PAS domain S-box protein [candidate division Zixibacteria bacterium]|nr:PAS domain S-box protein [candidate division Zixibacteria bacterium]